MSFDLSLEEGKILVKLAREAVETYLKTGKRIHVPEGLPQRLMQPCGVFVTINTVESGGEKLRGCIGLPYPTTPLAKAVVESAIGSATEDPRFYPISLNELDSVVFEVSVLTPPQLVEVEKPSDYPSKIKVGVDGLIIERGIYKGLLLPQVPVEWNWDEEEFLCQCCIKAGLPPDCWLMKGIRVYKFQAIIFEEESPKGEVRRKIIDGR
ncbi:MAG: TIGR00296 family protein [Candidatus Bathyarchaeia archaeon]